MSELYRVIAKKKEEESVKHIYAEAACIFKESAKVQSGQLSIAAQKIVPDRNKLRYYSA